MPYRKSTKNTTKKEMTQEALPTENHNVDTPVIEVEEVKKPKCARSPVPKNRVMYLKFQDHEGGDEREIEYMKKYGLKMKQRSLPDGSRVWSRRGVKDINSEYHDKANGVVMYLS